MANEKPVEKKTSARILSGRGVPIYLQDVDDEGNLLWDEEEPKTSVHLLRFDANSVSIIEEAFDGIQVQVDETKVTPIVDPSTGGIARDDDGKGLQVEEIVGQRTVPLFGIEAFAESMILRPQRTTRDAIAIALGFWDGGPDRSGCQEIGRRMVSGTAALDYQASVQVAWAVAQGLDPTSAAAKKLVRKLDDAIAAASDRMNSEIEEALDRP